MQVSVPSHIFSSIKPFPFFLSSFPTLKSSSSVSLPQLCILYMDDGWDRDQANRKRNKKKMSDIVVGPWGGNGGFVWDDGEYSGVREIVLYHDHCIDSITTVYDSNGKPVVSQKHGGHGGRMTEIKLEYPKEFLVGVSGHYAPYNNSSNPVIRSLMFRSNLRTYGPYGREVGTPFIFPMEGGQIAGFKGRCGRFMEAIGFYLTSAPTKQKTQKAPSNHGMPEIRIQHNDQYESSSWEDGQYKDSRDQY